MLLLWIVLMVSLSSLFPLSLFLSPQVWITISLPFLCLECLAPLSSISKPLPDSPSCKRTSELRAEPPHCIRSKLCCLAFITSSFLVLWKRQTRFYTVQAFHNPGVKAAQSFTVDTIICPFTCRAVQVRWMIYSDPSHCLLEICFSKLEPRTSHIIRQTDRPPKIKHIQLSPTLMGCMPSSHI